MQKFSGPVRTALAAAATGLIASTSAAAFEIKSPDIAEGSTLTKAQVYSGFGCTGDNISPALQWSGAPAGTKSFALTVYDPDAPTGSGWWHWVVYDLPASSTGVPRGVGKGAALPAGAHQGRNDFGAGDFGGACPPPGDAPHHYIFTVYALKVDKLGVPADATAALIGYNIKANSLGSATLTARYGR
ncbi:MAG TPA: YbhB/YbcL family Raf kinase inhibitor-like protein [Burkholderiaceae bacterium]|nr:YbhB/YbcL family Raf kinase inhibitor-like protein [Burkholderiaceae bacterium]